MQKERSTPVAARKLRIAVATRTEGSRAGGGPSHGSHLPPIRQNLPFPRRPMKNPNPTLGCRKMLRSSANKCLPKTLSQSSQLRVSVPPQQNHVKAADTSRCSDCSGNNITTHMVTVQKKVREKKNGQKICLVASLTWGRSLTPATL